jgi:hypothetical protein
MSKIHNFREFVFVPFKKRLGDFEASNHYVHPEAGVLPWYGEEVAFSRFKILKLEPNPYYGTEDEYVYDTVKGLYSKGEEPVKLHESVFKNKETATTLAWFTEVNNEELSPRLEIINERIFELDSTQRLIFLELAEETNNFIISQLEKNLLNVY